MKYMQPKIMVIIYLCLLVTSKSNNKSKGWGEGSEELEVSVTTIPGEVTEQVFGDLKDKKVTGKWASIDLLKGTCFTNLTAFCNEVIGSVYEGRAVYVAYVSFSKYSWVDYTLSRFVEIRAG